MLNLLILIVLSSNSFSGGFSRGSSFNYRYLEGEIEVQCPKFKAISFCRDQFLDPWPYDIFNGPKIVEANRVLFEVLNNSTQDIRTLEANYYGFMGKSEEINLGISSIFQKPLLKIGTNQIQYKLINKTGKKLFEGSFTVNVGRSTALTCIRQKFISQNEEDCELSYSICQQYFKDLNYCR